MRSVEKRLVTGHFNQKLIEKLRSQKERRCEEDRCEEDRCEEDRYEICARRIQVCWRSHQNRKVFKLLVNIMRSAEDCLTPAVLRQFSPREANLLRDPSLQCKVRIRFSGPQFPPVIVFKIFHTGRRGSYLSGKKLFQPSNQATAHTCRMMGNRKFMDLIMEDEIHWQGRTVSQPADVSCIRDYIQYSSHLDELPARVGGRENSWRRLSLKLLIRGLTGNAKYGLLGEELLSPTVTRRPDRPIRLYGSNTPTVRSLVAPPPSAVSTPGHWASKRRSARARTLADRMRRLYTPPEEERAGADGGITSLRLNQTSDGQMINTHSADEKLLFIPDECLALSTGSDCEWEEEAELLCSWSNQLTLDWV
ncbi:uncharacterized protein CXorf58 homolog isoform X2 [Hemibagrus wyckioides]|uniref:uncharacterized protein CXorf58 homolog isoform X2 n=1 Tax=Hemibagrus wyckioides TaxID=337641 RepID=UPI00266CC737|nr:uncharacterized protein CXorf58 homolog isoform X2 [Hemibagrus wyckioides]